MAMKGSGKQLTIDDDSKALESWVALPVHLSNSVEVCELLKE
jgi:hypothetical protein